MTHHNAHILAIALDPDDPLQLLTSLSYNGETSASIRCDVDRLDRAILSIFRNALAADVPLLVVIAKLRDRATTGEHFLMLNVKGVLRRGMDIVPETFVTTAAGELLTLNSEAFAPHVGNLPMPWSVKSIDERFAQFTSSLPSLPCIDATIPRERSCPKQWSL